MNKKLKFKSLLVCCLLLQYTFIQAQITSELSCGNTVERRSLTSTDIRIPNDFGSNYLSVVLRGADGGDGEKTGSICGAPVGKGGQGATITARFEIGGGTDQLRPNGLLRIIVGQAGVSQEASCLAFVDRVSGGGGSTALLYMPPERLPLDDNDEWIVLGIAGAGGGGYVDYGTNTYGGGGGRASENGGNSHSSAGGTFDSCPEVGGTDIVTAASGVGGGFRCNAPAYNGKTMDASTSIEFGATNSIKIVLDPNKPASSTGGSHNLTVDGGNGFSGGGGGGGVFGGGTHAGHGGGGGGSFLTNAIRKTAGNIQAGIDGGGSRSSGYVALTTNNDPVQAIAKNTTVTLNDAGTATINPGHVNNGSFGGCGVINYTVSPTTFNCSNLGPNTVVLRMTDQFGNVSTASSIVTIVPGINIKTKNITRSLNSDGTVTITAADIDNGSSVSCGAIAAMTIAPSTFDCTQVGENTVSFTVTDGFGFSSSATATLTVVDDEPPVVQPIDITLQLDENGQASIANEDIIASTSDNCGTPTINLYGNTTFDCSNFGPNVVVIEAIDANGNIAQFIARVEVQSTEVRAKDIIVSLDANGTASITPADVDDGSSTVCGEISSMIVSPNTFSCSDIGSNPVVFMVSDGNGFTTETNVTVTVLENSGPEAKAKDITVPLDANGTASITAADVDDGSGAGCGSIASMAVSPSTFSCSDLGANTVTLTVTDVDGNVNTTEATVTVEDNMAPIASCPSNLVADTENLIGSPLSSLLVQRWQSFTVQNSGELSGFEVFLNTFSPSPTTAPVSVKVYAGEGVSGTPVLTTTRTITLTNMVQWVNLLVNQSIPVLNGNKYTVAIQAPSYAGFQWTIGIANPYTAGISNTGNNRDFVFKTTVNAYVPIPVQLDASGTVSITPELVDAGSSDACGIANLSLSKQSFDCSEVGTHLITLTATDLNGNSSNCQATVSVVDDIPPSLTCPQAMAIQTDPGECGAYVSLPKAAPADNCGIPDLQSRYRALDAAGSSTGSWSAWAVDQSGFFSVGVFEIQWRAKDAADNEAFCSFQLEVKDEEKPELVCKDLTINFNGEASINIPSTSIFDAAASFDACGPVSYLAQTLSEVNCAAVGQIIAVGVKGVDQNGNTNVCTANITVTGQPCGFTATGIACEDGAVATYDPVAETFTLSAQDCTGYPDGELSFVGTALCGDGEIIVHVDALNAYARAGIAMMESSDPGARMVALVKDLSPRVRTEYRSSTDGSLSVKNKNRPGVDWLRIVRVGNKFKTYTSTNGFYWRKAHTIEFESFEDCLEVGLITYTKDTDEEAVAVFSQLKITGENTSYTQSPIPSTAMESHSAKHQLGASTALRVSPNPFRDETRINFTLDQAQQISLAVYNLQGQLVQRVEDSLLDAGTHVRTWEGTNQAGAKMPSGIYLIQLRIADQLINKRVVLQE